MGQAMEKEISALNEKMPAQEIEKEVFDDLENRFTYHKPKEGQPEIYLCIRNLAKIYSKAIVHYTPKSREQSLALTKLEEVVFWANAAVARKG